MILTTVTFDRDITDVYYRNVRYVMDIKTVTSVISRTLLFNGHNVTDITENE